MKQFKSHIIGLMLMILGVTAIGVGLNDGLADDETLGTSFGVSNSAPVFTTPPSDGGSDTATPANVGSNVTFTALGTDLNSDDYYLAVCKTNAVTAGNNAAPTCGGGAWAISVDSTTDPTPSEPYTTLVGDAETNAWYAFLCDKVSGGGACYPANGSGDQGNASGSLTFTGVPEDGDAVTIDSVTYEFDTAGDGIGGGTEVDTAASASAADAVAQFVSVEAGTSSHMVQRGAVVYVYADTAGITNPTIAITEPDNNEGGSTDEITFSGETLLGGSDSKSSPFEVNHAGTFGTVTVTDQTDGEINPGDSLRFAIKYNVPTQANLADVNTAGGQDTMNMFICTDATTAFDYSADSCTNGSLVCSTQDWEGRALIESGSFGGGYPTIASDPSGNAIAVWHQFDGVRTNIYANRYDSSTGWGTEELIEASTQSATYPQITSDPSGNMIAVWIQSDGSNASIYANRYDYSTGWGTAELIEAQTGGNADSVQIASDPSGNMIAVWRQNNGAQYDVYANRYDSSTGWETEALIETTGTGPAAKPQIASDPSGNMIAVWEQFDGVLYNIYANRYDSSTGWGTSGLIEANDTSNAYYPGIASDPSGNMFAVWAHHDLTRYNIYANRYDSSTGWGTAELIETGNGSSSTPRIASDPSGNMIAVWHQHDGSMNSIYANRYTFGGSWGTEELIEVQGGGHAEQAQITSDSSGNMIAVWHHYDSIRWNVRANRYTFGSGWGDDELLEASDTGNAQYPEVASDALGNAIAVWQQTDGANDIYANRYSASGVDPTTTDATCDETGNVLVPPSDTGGVENFKVYVEDIHSFAGTGTNNQTYTIANTAPTHDTPGLDVHAATLPNSVGYWQFEDGDSATAFDDETSNENDATCTNCPDWTEEGFSGGAYYFDPAGDDAVSVTNDSSLNPTAEVTVATWVKSDTNGTAYAAAWPIIYSSYIGGGSAKGFWLGINQSNGKFRFGTANAGSQSTVESTSAVIADTWYYVVATFDGTQECIYVNGTGNCETPSISLLEAYTSSKYIGNNSGGTSDFDGLIDEPHIYDRALTADEIAQQYAAYTGAPETNLVSHWSFNDGPDGYTKVLAGGEEGSWDTSWIGTPSVIKDGNTYKMWYAGNNGLGTRIIYAESDDGLTWTNYDQALDINQCSNCSWDTMYVTGPSVIKDGDIYKMWVNGYDGSYFRIMYTTSVDGIDWAAPVQAVDIGSEGTWDTDDVVDTMVIKDGSTYKMWYRGSDNFNYRILYADSTDGITWINHQLVVDINQEGTWDTTYLASPYVIKDGTTYKMWYAGYDGSNYRMLYSTSTNGTTWTSPIRLLDLGQAGTWDEARANYPSVLKEGDAYRMWYGGSSALSVASIIHTKINYADEFGGSDGVMGGGTPNLLSTGYYGKAVDFNGTTDHIEIPGGPFDGFADGSVSFWTQFNSVTSDDYAFYAEESGTDYIGMWMGSDGVFDFNLKRSNTNAIASAGGLIAGQWYYVVGTWDGVNVKLYIDGSLSDATLSSNTTSGLDSSSYTTIGRRDSFTFDGSIDEFRIYSNDLTATEVQQLYYASKYHDSNQDLSCKALNLDDHDSDSMTTIFNWEKDGSSTTVLNMPFDSNITSTATDAVLDYSGNANYGQLGDGTAGYVPTWSSTGIKGGAYDFDGVDDRILVADSTSIDVFDAFSAELWFKADSYSTDQDADMMMHKYNWNTSGGGGFAVAVVANTGIDLPKLGAGMAIIKDQALLEVASGSLPSLGVWHHLVNTYDGTTIKAYLDGVEVDSEISTYGSLDSTGRYLEIGDDNFAPTPNGREFDGMIDEIHLYDFALSAEQIHQNYNNGIPNYNTIVNQETDEADVSWQCKATINDAQATNPDSITNSSNIIDPSNSEPVQNFPSSRAHALLDVNSVGYWQFEGGDLTSSILDETTNSNDGTCTTCPTWTAEGAIGGGYEFDGVDDYITATSGYDFSGSGTVSLWFNAEIITDAQTLFHTSNGSNRVSMKLDGSHIRNCYYDTSYHCKSSSFVYPNQWMHAVFVWDGADPLLYIDGVVPTGSVLTASGDFTTSTVMGSRGSGTLEYFHGSLDEVHVYDRALSATEVANLYNSTSYVYDSYDLGVSSRDMSDADNDSLYATVDWRESDTSIAVLNMSFNEDVTVTTADSVIDYSSYANHGQLGGGTASAVPTWTNATTCGNNSGGCYDFDGTDDYIVVTDTNDFNAEEITIEAWVKWEGGGLSDSYTIVSNYAGATTEQHYGLHMTIGGYVSMFYDNGAAFDKVTGNSYLINDGNWHHVVGTLSTNNEAKVYVDGLLDETDSYVSNLVLPSDDLYIGRDGFAELELEWNGKIDEVKVYDTILDAEQVSRHHNAGKPNYQNVAYSETVVGETWKSLTIITEGNSESSVTLESNDVEILGFSSSVTEKWDDTTYNEFWDSQTSGVANQLYDIHFIDSNIGWLTGQGATVLKTIDGGVSWSAQNIGTNQPINKFDFYDANTGWAVGNTDTIIYTTNGGASWDAQISPTSGKSLNGVEFIDAQIGYIVGSDGAILKTINGGSTWVSQTSPTANALYDVTCFDANTCWAVGGSGTLVHTSTGTDWSTQTSPTGNYFYGVSFADASNGWAVGSNGALVHTSNGGANWTYQEDGLGTTNLNDVHFINSTTGWISAHSGNILKTTNGGTDWATETSGAGTNALRGLYCVDANNCWSVGDNGTLLKGGFEVESSDTHSTHAGEDIEFKGKFNTSGADYYLTICKTDAITAGDDAAPTCTGGSWAISAATNDFAEATAVYATSSGDSESNVWYAFACTKEVGGGTCSVSTQGSGNSGSPFVVNHAPAVGTVNIGATCETTTSVDPANSGDATFLTTVGTAYDVAYSVALQSDGKAVIAGTTNSDSDYDFAIVRIHADGTLDTSFDTDGKVTTDFGSATDWGKAVAIQSDDKIVVAGYYDNGATNDFAVARYNANGSLDTTFDTDGKAVTPVATGHDSGEAVAIQSDGKIVVVGTSDNAGNAFDFAMARFNANGSLDTSFDTDGKVLTQISTNSPYYDFAKAVAIQPSDQKIVVAGYAHNGTDYDFTVVRYNTDGSLDTSFDTDGKVVTPIGSGADRPGSVAIDSNGKIVVAGSSNNGVYDDFAVVRYNSNGSLDTTFDTDGKMTVAFGSGNSEVRGLDIQSDGKILLVGYGTVTNIGFALVRLNTNGSLDTTFDTDGKLYTAIGGGSNYANAIVLQSDGKIVAVGYGSNGSNDDFAYARYNTDGSVDDLSGYVCVSAGVSDSNANNIIDVHVCSTDSFTGGTCDGTTYCTIEGVVSGENAQCVADGLVPIPTAHGSKNTYVFAVDSNGLPDAEISHTESYSVTDTPPYISNAVDYTANPLTPTAGTTTAYNFTATIKDDNGDDDITAASGAIYDSASTSLTSGTCSDDELDCYTDASCTLSNNTSGTDNTATVQCDYSVAFNANASSSWKAHVNPSDEQGSITDQTDSNAFQVQDLQALNVVQISIVYGVIEIGRSSDGQTAVIENLGNKAIDLTVQGDDMCTDYQTCIGDVLVKGQQKYHNTDSNFTWAQEGSALVGTALSDCTPSVDCDETHGCVNRSIEVRPVSGTGSTDESIYWRIFIPVSQAPGSYTGQNTIGTTASDSCVGNPY